MYRIDLFIDPMYMKMQKDLMEKHAAEKEGGFTHFMKIHDQLNKLIDNFIKPL